MIYIRHIVFFLVIFSPFQLLASSIKYQPSLNKTSGTSSYWYEVSLSPLDYCYDEFADEVRILNPSFVHDIYGYYAPKPPSMNHELYYNIRLGVVNSSGDLNELNARRFYDLTPEVGSWAPNFRCFRWATGNEYLRPSSVEFVTENLNLVELIKLQSIIQPGLSNSDPRVEFELIYLPTSEKSLFDRRYRARLFYLDLSGEWKSSVNYILRYNASDTVNVDGTTHNRIRVSTTVPENAFAVELRLYRYGKSSTQSADTSDKPDYYNIKLNSIRLLTETCVPDITGSGCL